MDPVLKLAIEAASLVGVVVLAAVSTPVLGGKRWDRAQWLRSAGILVVGLVYLFVNPRGWPDPFPVVIGTTAVVVAVVGLMMGATLGWQFVHGQRQTAMDRQTAISFGAMGLFGLCTLVCLVGAVICIAGIVDGLGVQSAYDHAPDCATSSSNACRMQTGASVVRTWAESSRGRHWIEVHLPRGNQTIEVTTANNVWRELAPGARVAITFWKGQVTDVNLPGVGSMQTVDSPNFGVFAAVALLAGSLVGLLLFGLFAIMYWLKWLAGRRGIDTGVVAA